MARTTQTQDTTQERLSFLRELLREQPTLSRLEAGDSFRNRFNVALSPRLFAQVKEEAQAQAEAPAPEAEVEESEAEELSSAEDASARLQGAASMADPSGLAAPGPKAKAPKAKGTRFLFVEAPREQLSLLERTLLQLQESGSNVRIDHTTERWVVLAVDAK